MYESLSGSLTCAKSGLSVGLSDRTIIMTIIRTINCLGQGTYCAFNPALMHFCL